VGGVVVATAFHEIGHASAVRYGGAKPGVMGVGVYIVWPAFYTDITDAYRLDKKGRLRTDLGGMYFNMVFALAVAGAYAATGFEPLILLIVLQTFVVIQQSLPFLRLDGYYVISDLTGVPDILLRMRSILTSVLPWRKPDERVTELKPWVRRVVTGYVLVLVPVVVFIFLMLLMNAPRVFATGWDSFWLHWDRVGPRFSAGETARGAMTLFQMLVLVLPSAGLVYTTSRVGYRAGSFGWRWSDGSPRRRATLLAGTLAAASLAGFLLWPHGA
jgi:putative peptide zinc metalloprotease protein